MRIVGGEFRGTALAGLGKGDPGAHLRPTTDRVRETLFNVLAGGKFGDPVSGAHVLDLFAGTGALGLEALSRGAAGAVFVDDGGKARGLIRDNIARTRTEALTQILKRDATRLPANTGAPATLVFLDPPYGKGLGGKALASADAGDWIARGALIVWEESAAQSAPAGFTRLDQRRYGDTTVTFLERE
ncbi:16S rRNA (guanine(966)-N(2))-methyltransferase RsmD [Poseidonocella sedimentorum]|uniref:16S rRNA (Guanine966-N2)-methyltransferase n=1 Tax=Poseidonocella sedimentorum TaxID=871652 RepID=A0A1I6D8S7_9RHOB|nr:16S rRNA (guanine(966)-N(2))-methyltransferase RsmD [Poseidonocella sedimentorum]SFR01771.1 16S rRNA (guanine966-N2)-methyltransferase [Poseidonocella sedimentorum]